MEPNTSAALFQDSDFLLSNELLPVDIIKKYKDQIKWMRPSEICDTPCFVVGKFSRLNVNQGELGDCWVLSSIDALLCNCDAFKKVVPLNQTFETVEGYCGKFRFNFFRNGDWMEIVIDDLLPTFKKNLIFAKATKNNFWTPLLEKAYAKFVGSYRDLNGGHSAKALFAFSGGDIKRFILSKSSSHLFEILLNLKSSVIVTASIFKNENDHEVEIMGLKTLHGYSVTRVENVIYQGRIVKLIQLINPWGKDEWKGDFSDNSTKWDGVSDHEQKRLNFVREEDGEFFMPFEEFIKFFDELVVCHLNPKKPLNNESNEETEILLIFAVSKIFAIFGLALFSSKDE